MPGDGSGAGRFPIVVYNASGAMVLAVDLARQRNGRRACRLPHVRLSPDVVARQLNTDEGATVTFSNLDDGAEACEPCMAADAQLRAREIQRGRDGRRGVVHLRGVGLRMPLVPDDSLYTKRRGNQVLVAMREPAGSVVKVGHMDASDVPQGWRISLRVLRSSPYQIPVRVSWRPRK